MKKRSASFWILNLLFLILISVSSAYGAITTGAVSPDSVSICGAYASEQVLSASDITNTGSGVLENVEAKLVIPSAAGLSVITQNSVSIGNITNGSKSSVNPAWGIKCDPGNLGTFNLYVEYLQGGTKIATTEGNKEFSVQVSSGAKLTVTSSSPRGYAKKYLLNVTTNIPSVCRFSTADSSFSGMNSEFSTTGATTHTYGLSLPDGDYTYFVRCRDTDGNEMKISERIDFTIDTVAPVIKGYAPRGIVNTRVVNLNITTDDESVCSYESSTALGNLARVSENVHALDTTLSKGENVFTVYCTDSAGNEGIHQDIYLFLSEEPTAEIELSSNSPLKPGTVDITLTSSVDLAEKPSLWFNLEDGKKNLIPLTGKDDDWKGTLIIPGISAEQVGLFTWEGEDEFGTVGTEITEGAIFIVDPVLPGVPIDLKITRTKPTTSNQGNKTRLVWKAPEEGIDNYVIYRSRTRQIDSSHRYKTVTNEAFTDNDESGGPYYYAVSAVDRAGNEGALSQVVALDASYEPETGESSEVMVLVDPAIFDKEIIGLEGGVSEIRDIIRSTRSELRNLFPDEVELLGLVQSMRASELELSRISREISELGKDMSVGSFEKASAKISAKISSLKAEVPKELIIVDETRFFDDADSGDIEEILAGLFENAPAYLVENAAKDLRLSNKDIRIETRASIVMVTYLDGTQRLKTIVRREGNLPDGEIIEFIPKNVARSASEIIHEGIVLKDDPIIKFSASSRWGYAMDKRVMFDLIKDTKSVYVNDLQELEQALEPSNRITGNFIAGLGLTSSSPLLGVAAVAVLSGILAYFLLFYSGPRQKAGNGLESSGFLTGLAMDSLGFGRKTVSEYIDEAHGAVNSLNLDKARRIYLKLHKSADKMSISSEHMRSIHCLYHKMRACAALENIKDALQQKDYAQAQRSRNELRTAIPHLNVTEKSELIDEIVYYQNILRNV